LALVVFYGKRDTSLRTRTVYVTGWIELPVTTQSSLELSPQNVAESYDGNDDEKIGPTREELVDELATRSGL
jgi:hypothetical protein